MSPQTLYHKLWDGRAVHVEDDGTTVLHIDCHPVNEVTSPQAFEGLKLARRTLWRASANFATADHNVPTTDRSLGISDSVSGLQVDTLVANCKEFGIVEFGMNDPRQGTAGRTHLVSPEMVAAAEIAGHFVDVRSWR